MASRGRILELVKVRENPRLSQTPVTVTKSQLSRPNAGSFPRHLTPTACDWEIKSCDSACEDLLSHHGTRVKPFRSAICRTYTNHSTLRHSTRLRMIERRPYKCTVTLASSLLTYDSDLLQQRQIARKGTTQEEADCCRYYIPLFSKSLQDAC